MSGVPRALQEARECPRCGGPMSRASTHCMACYRALNRGERHHSHGKTRGGSPSVRGWAEARRRYSLEGVTCEYAGCTAPALDRHHRDGDPTHNERSNVQLLCRRHHQVIDGRADRGRAWAQKHQWKPGESGNPLGAALRANDLVPVLVLPLDDERSGHA